MLSSVLKYRNAVLSGASRPMRSDSHLQSPHDRRCGYKLKPQKTRLSIFSPDDNGFSLKDLDRVPTSVVEISISDDNKSRRGPRELARLAIRGVPLWSYDRLTSSPLAKLFGSHG